MTPDEIIEMAKRARLHRNQHNLASNPVQYRFSYDGTEEALIAFAKLVAEKEREEVERLKALCQEMLSELYVYRASEYLKDVTATIKTKGLA